MMLRASAGSELKVMSLTISVSVLAAEDSPDRRRMRKQSSEGRRFESEPPEEGGYLVVADAPGVTARPEVPGDE